MKYKKNDRLDDGHAIFTIKRAEDDIYSVIIDGLHAAVYTEHDLRNHTLLIDEYEKEETVTLNLTVNKRYMELLQSGFNPGTKSNSLLLEAYKKSHPKQDKEE